MCKCVYVCEWLTDISVAKNTTSLFIAMIFYMFDKYLTTLAYLTGMFFATDLAVH